MRCDEAGWGGVVLLQAESSVVFRAVVVRGEMSGSQVRVYVRLAPVAPAGAPREGIAMERRTLRLEEPGGDRVSDFLFDGIFPEASEQDEVYARVAAPLVESLVQGVNSCCLAYGQSAHGWGSRQLLHALAMPILAGCH